MAMKIDVESRFWSKVDRRTDEDCWEWTAARTTAGYGMFRVSTRRRSCAHRVAYELAVAPIPEGLQIDHLCRNRSCVNPAHLDVVTPRENVARSSVTDDDRRANIALAIPAAAREKRSRTHCHRGHGLTPENIRISAAGWRNCRACGALYQRAYRQRRRRTG